MAKKRKHLCVICINDGGLVIREEMRVLKGVVYMTKSRVPSTEPWVSSVSINKRKFFQNGLKRFKVIGNGTN